MSDGRHLILDMYGCSKAVLDDRQLLVQALESALRMAKANVLRIISNKFEPQGVTVLALLAESHASIHTWPEIGYCAIDLYTCGEETDTHAKR
jgi:S-adenosylmethionine decarboxylase